MKLGLALVLALLSAAALNWGFYRQHEQASSLPPLSLRRPVRSLLSLFRNPRWFVGFAVGILGWVFYVAALAYGPLSLVQAASAGGIGILALLVWRFGGVALTRREWLGVGVSIGGLVALGVSLIGSGGNAHHWGHHAAWPAVAGWLLVSGVLAAFFAGPGRRLVVPGAGLGIAAGFLYAAGDVGTKAAVAGGWQLLFVPALLAAHGLGFVTLQLAFQQGTALATAGVATLFTNAVPIAAGMVVFHEPLPSGMQGLLRVVAFVAVVAGAALLTRSSPDAGTPDDSDGSPAAAELEASRKRRRQAAVQRKRRRRLLATSIVLLALLSPGVYSYARWMSRPTSMSVGVRSVEWARTQPGGNRLVDYVEHIYYSWKAPKQGGPQLTALPTIGETTRRKAAPAAAAWPPRIRPVFARALPGEGAWKPTGPPVLGGPPVLVATFRPELDYPRVVAYVAWFDHRRTAIAFYPGRYEPPSAAVRGPAMVPYGQRWRLLATFNAAFTYKYGGNGSAIGGRVNEPLKTGLATLVGYRDGRLAIVKWAGGSAASRAAWVRQSLPPIVWNGKVNPALDSSLKWGETIGNTLRVWRTGVGIDRRGNLIFVAADAQTVTSLAQILVHVGATRAMQFDINPYWHTLITYRHHHGLVPTMIEPQPNHSAQRYLVPDDRDFFAVYRRLPGPVTVPFK